MNIIDAAAIGILAFYFITGYMSGILRKILNITVSIISLAVSIICYNKGAGLLSAIFLFILVSLVLNIAVWLWLRMKNKDGRQESFFSRMAGGIAGGLEGAIYVLIMLTTVNSLRSVVSAVNPAIARQLESSSLFSSYRKLNNGDFIQVNNKEERKKIELDPRTVDRLRENPSIKAVLEDKQLISSMQKKDYAGIFSNPAFLKIINDKKLLEELMGALPKDN